MTRWPLLVLAVIIASLPFFLGLRVSSIAVDAPAPVTHRAPTIAAREASLAFPISRASARITKKPFGLLVSPKHSPVTPERFSGYHTGVDFETFPEEQKTDVAITAVCDGTVLLKRFSQGYGGVVVQACTVNGKAVTVIYGHLALSSIPAKIGTHLSVGQRIGQLGRGYSTETDGERKHLHFGVHQGSSINLRGYVGSTAALKAWLDPVALFL